MLFTQLTGHSINCLRIFGWLIYPPPRRTLALAKGIPIVPPLIAALAFVATLLPCSFAQEDNAALLRKNFPAAEEDLRPTLGWADQFLTEQKKEATSNTGCRAFL